MANLTPILLNNVYSTVQAGSSAIGSSSATGINVATGDGAKFGSIGTNQYIPAVIVDTSTSPETVKEYVWITAISTDVLTVVRQSEESSRYAASTTSIAAGYTIAGVASRQALNVAKGSALPSLHSLLAWSFDPLLAGANLSAIYQGYVNLVLIPVPVAISVTNVLVYISSGSGLTSGQNLAGLYDSSGSLLASTADQTTAWGNSGLQTMALTGAPIAIAGGPDVYVYAALLTNGGTSPAFGKVTISGGGLTWPVTVGMPSTRARFFRTASNGNTSLPSTITLSSAVADSQSVWAGLS